jgi:hypothetical protein
MRSGLENCFQLRPRETRPLLDQFGLDPLMFQHKRHENCFAASLLIGRHAGESLAAIN